MLKIKFFAIAFVSLVIAKEGLQAHSHHHDTYIVEQAPVVVVQPQPIVVVQQAPTPAVNALPFEAPPVDLVEQIPASPGEMYVWQKGHWQWNGSWVWSGGQWTLRPNNHDVYVPGYWKLSTHHHRWEWVAPYWK